MILIDSAVGNIVLLRPKLGD